MCVCVCVSAKTWKKVSWCTKTHDFANIKHNTDLRAAPNSQMNL